MQLICPVILKLGRENIRDVHILQALFCREVFIFPNYERKAGERNGCRSRL